MSPEPICVDKRMRCDSPPDSVAAGTYLGLRVLPGDSDAFRLNYDGLLPSRRAAFGSEAERPVYIGLSNTLIAPATILAPVLGGLIADLAGR